MLSRGRMVAGFRRTSFEYCGVISGIAVAAYFLSVKNLDGSVEFVRSFRLLDPIAVQLLVLISPTDQLGCDCLGNTTTHAATLLYIEISVIRFHQRSSLGEINTLAPPECCTSIMLFGRERKARPTACSRPSRK